MNCTCDIHFNEDVFKNPFNCAIEEVPSNLQVEVINLQCNDILKSKYQENNLMNPIKKIPKDKYNCMLVG